MDGADIDPLYEAFGSLVRMHRGKLTQESLGKLVGLSRTSITNIEKGRQHISLHQFFAIAEALKVPADALLPRRSMGTDSAWVAEKLPEWTDRALTKWASRVVQNPMTKK